MAPAAAHCSAALSLQELPYTKDVIEAGLAEDTHLYYMALIERGTGRRTSLPHQTPLQGSFWGSSQKIPLVGDLVGDVFSLPSSAKLQAAVVLNPGYSTLPPVFSLCLNWKGERTSSNDDNIRVTRSGGGENRWRSGGGSWRFRVHQKEPWG